MTPESLKSPLLDNGSLKHVSSATDKLEKKKNVTTKLTHFYGDADSWRPTSYGSRFPCQWNQQIFHGYEQATNVFHGDRKLYKAVQTKTNAEN
jgi:hypothetical protein